MKGGGGPLLLRARLSLRENAQRSSRIVLKDTLSISALSMKSLFGEIQNQNLHFISSLDDDTMCAQTS